MTDKQLENRVPPVGEPPILWDRVEEIPPSLRETGPTRTLANQGDDEARETDDQRDAVQPPPLSDEYDLSLVDDERELRRQARR
ncbi:MULTISPECIES: hypothetical protein [Pseudomonas]|uniref:Uncharacterized protein n=2 Tax=Pseudomonadaceae TaxID=135621 RepID=A0A0D0IC19_9PSED|nr:MULTISPECIES: hypothetical protein [Pseudomonas]KIP90412.1 hypothetical protein RU08_22895 [Pseudomonas fulva]MCW2290883.1 hypothetical protein [Pseudomonas sp. BIGb0408]NYH74546.1 hypothetical protein [Pseudomonas flavescens]